MEGDGCAVSDTSVGKWSGFSGSQGSRGVEGPSLLQQQEDVRRSEAMDFERVGQIGADTCNRAGGRGSLVAETERNLESSPIFLVPKHGPKLWCLVIDMRRLNSFLNVKEF